MPVKLVWITPEAEKLIAHTARVSNPAGQERGDSPERLVSYLVRNRHWSPFEMVNACFEIDTTRDIARQMLRHRSLSFQELSQRYQQVDVLPKAALREARLQDDKNRQNSLSLAGHKNEIEIRTEWTRRQTAARHAALEAYEWALRFGLAKEVARAVLPEGLTASRMYANGTLRSWVHYCELRTAPGTQLEHREIALAIAAILAREVPSVWAAVRAAKEHAA